MAPKVLFINPPSVPCHHLDATIANRQTDIGNFLKQQIAMPMGILYLSAVLEKEIPGVDIRILDFAKALRESGPKLNLQFGSIDEFFDYFLRSIPSTFVPDVAGISILFSTAHRTSGFIADAIKRRWPGVPVIVGGMHATNAAPSLLAMPSVDYVCRGEGEAIIADLVRRIVEHLDCEQIQGILGRKKLSMAQGQCLESAPLIDDLDLIPFPAWHLIPMGEYVHSMGSRVRRIDEIEHDREATIVTTRGCPFHCTFCSSWTVHGRKMRFRTVSNVLAELDILHNRYGVNMVVPEDDLFTVRKPRIIELCNTVADHFRGAMHFQFPNGLSVATLDRDVVSAMVRMGMTLANVAIESGSPYVQEYVIKKHCDLDRARRVVRECRDAGIQVRTYFVVGFPGERIEHMRETLEFAASLASDWSHFHIAAPLVGTEMYQQMLERGDIDQAFNWDAAFFMERAFDTVEISATELKTLVSGANIRLNFFENYNLKVGHYDRALTLFKDVLTTHPGHLAAQYAIGRVHKMMGDDAGFFQALGKCKRQLELSGMAREQLRLHGELFPELGNCLEQINRDSTPAHSRHAAEPGHSARQPVLARRPRSDPTS